MSWRILEGDCRTVLATLDAGSVQTCVTSPPYFGLRDYGTPGQLGLEPTPDEYVTALVGVFHDVRRVLRDDGTAWLNLGDSYSGSPRGNSDTANFTKPRHEGGLGWTPEHAERGLTDYRMDKSQLPGVKPKDLLGIPWMVAFALRADGWYLRSDIIWAKPNPMPESVTDRPTKAHEYVFLLSKSARYFYDADAIREPLADITVATHGTRKVETDWGNLAARGTRDHKLRSFGMNDGDLDRGANKRSVWTVATQPYSGTHFATFPPKLIEPCILAGSAPGDLVLDPFAGSGTTGIVALRHDRSFAGIELNPGYVEMARWRIRDDSPLLNGAAEVAA